MANYSHICGFEIGHLKECYTSTGSPSVQSTYKRSGSYALRCHPTLDAYHVTFESVSAGGTLRAIFGAVRIYLRVLSLPSAFIHLISIGGGTQQLDLFPNGQLSFTGSGIYSSSSLSADGAFHKISIVYSGTTWKCFVDGSEWLNYTGGAFTVADSLTIGVLTGSTADLVFDDILTCSDGNDGVDLPDGNALLLLPTSDSSRATWTAGAGGTTNLYDALNNIIPNGFITPNDTSQIKNADKTGSQDYTATMQSYTTGGVGSSDTVNAVMAICNDAEGVATGTKDGGIWIASNPAQTAGGNTFDFGDDVGAMGNFPMNWATHTGPVSATPTVTKGTAPTVTVRKTATTTRETHVDFLGLYVDYTPATVLIDNGWFPQVVDPVRMKLDVVSY